MTNIIITCSTDRCKGTLSDRNIPTREYFTDEPGPRWTQDNLAPQRYEFECSAEANPGTVVTVAVYDASHNNAVLGSNSAKADDGGAAQVKVFFSVVPNLAAGLTAPRQLPYAKGSISLRLTLRNVGRLLLGRSQ